MLVGGVGAVVVLIGIIWMSVTIHSTMKNTAEAWLEEDSKDFTLECTIPLGIGLFYKPGPLCQTVYDGIKVTFQPDVGSPQDVKVDNVCVGGNMTGDLVQVASFNFMEQPDHATNATECTPGTYHVVSSEAPLWAFDLGDKIADAVLGFFKIIMTAIWAILMCCCGGLCLCVGGCISLGSNAPPKEPALLYTGA